MSDEPKELEQVTPQDVDAVTEKLKEWIPTLPEQEQLVLGWMLTRAASASDGDAKEYAERTQGGVPVATLMAEAAGLEEVTGYAKSTTPDIGPVKIWAYHW
jgi:hypothetical protein